MDPRELNEAISREQYPLKTFEEVAANLKHAKQFTILDALSGITKSSELKRALGSLRFGRCTFLDIFSSRGVLVGYVSCI